MSSPFGYLIPNKPFEVGQFKKLLTSILEKEEIIDGYYDEELQWFAMGNKSHYIFKDVDDELPHCFEFVEIHDTINNRIIPDCTSEKYGAKCKNCKEDLDDSLNDVLMELAELESENGIESDMTRLVIICRSCNNANKITDIDFDLTVKFNSQFACFVEINSDFDEDKISQIAKFLNCNFDIIYGRH